jgi:hypothetical protein
MQRKMLRLTLILGVIVTIVGGTGVFASFSDLANGGINTVTSGARPHAADLLIAAATLENQAISCGTFDDSMTTSQFTVRDFQPNLPTVATYICLKNAGAAKLALRMGIGPLTNSDSDCTGDEEANGDLTCGGGQEGELAELLILRVTTMTCSDGATTSSAVASLMDIADVPLAFGGEWLAPAGIECVRINLDYDFGATELQIQLAQSDTASWRFGFQGTAS